MAKKAALSSGWAGSTNPDKMTIRRQKVKVSKWQNGKMANCQTIKTNKMIKGG
jgi:hypothetical protein